jgi:hypothetical protein
MWLSPALIPATTRSETSKPITRYPLRATSTASGSPTYPSPITPTTASRLSMRASSISREVARSEEGTSVVGLMRLLQVPKHASPAHRAGARI